MTKTPPVFYRNTLSAVFLSDHRIDEIDLDDLHYEVNEGDLILHSMTLDSEERTREQIDQDLIDAGSDPSFFGELE